MPLTQVNLITTKTQDISWEEIVKSKGPGLCPATFSNKIVGYAAATYNEGQ